MLGKTGEFDGDDLRKILTDHPATSHRLAWRLCRCLMGEGVAEMEDISALAHGLQQNNLDIRWAVDTILRSDLFFSMPNINARVSSPVEFVVGTIRSLELFNPPPNSIYLGDWCRRLGQDLFNPPNVGGWNEGRNWLVSQGIVGRANFATALVNGKLGTTHLPLEIEPWIRDHSEVDSVDEAIQFLGRVLFGVELESDERLELSANLGESLGPDVARRLAERTLSHPIALLT